MDKYDELLEKAPYWDEIIDNYDPSSERIREQNYRLDLDIERLKRSL